MSALFSRGAASLKELNQKLNLKLQEVAVYRFHSNSICALPREAQDAKGWPLLQEKEKGLEPTGLGSSTSFATDPLCDLGQVPWPL
jgi:hypothetical protein